MNNINLPDSEDFLQIVHYTQFRNYLKSLLELSNELNNGYNLFNHQLFTVKLYNILTDGYDYIVGITSSNKYPKINPEKMQFFYPRLLEGLIEMKKQFTEDEFLYLGYKRHNVCHIFQWGYERIQSDGKIKETRNERGIDGKEVIMGRNELSNKFISVLYDYGGENEGDKNFNIKKTKLIYPIARKLYEDLF